MLNGKGKGGKTKERLWRTLGKTTGQKQKQQQQQHQHQHQNKKKKSLNAANPMPYNDNHKLPLYTYDQIPTHLFDNPYILTGYRMGYSTFMCLHSIFSLHNETLNIWTHLLGFVLFVIVIVFSFISVLLPGYDHKNKESDADLLISSRSNWMTFLVFGAYSFGCLICLLCSTAFHTLLPHKNMSVYGWAHALDYFGITFLVVGSFLPFCYFCFACEPFWQVSYLIMISVFGIIGLLGPFFRHWVQKQYSRPKIFFYICMVGSGLFPITHMYVFFPGNVVSFVLEGLFLMLTLYAVGLFIYVFQIPEFFFPGKFDLYLSSHQIWHVFVLAAAFVHFFNSISMYVNLRHLHLSC